MKYAVGLIAMAIAAPAWADPCEGKLPSKAGSVFAGQVRYIVDGDGFCVGASTDPATWIEVRMADFDAPELATQEGKRGKAIMEQHAMSREISCTTRNGRNGTTTTYDRVLASCRINGESLASVLRRAGAPEGGN